MTQSIERRTFAADMEVREDAGGISFRGYAAIFDSPSNGEVVRRSAFTKTLGEQADVRLLVNHDGVPLARTKSGTLALGVDDRGLWADTAKPLDPANPTVQELASAMRREDIDQMSFAFMDRTPSDQRYSDDGTREIRDCQLFDVSIVTFPWYGDTSASLKSVDDAYVALRSGTATKQQRDLILSLYVESTDPDDETETEPDEAASDTLDNEPLPADLLTLYEASWLYEVERTRIA